MFGLSQAQGADVHLSDGGHFENMAIYELIRRRCRFIVASDCGQDPDVAFDDFGNLVRRVREDFGVEIQIDLSPLRPGSEQRARQPMVAGDIYYPHGDTGVLLLFKPTLVGNEPVDVAQYKTRNEAFPHESTGDQFYDEAQWESYRRLGEHAVFSAFGSLVAGLHDDDPNRAAKLFARARREWLPIPPGYEGRVTQVASRIAELDELLVREGCDALLREVYKEVDELDRQARNRTTVPVQGTGTHFDPIRLMEVVGLAPTRGEAEPAFEFGEDIRPDDIVASLHLVRRAILCMEEVYVSEDLETRYHHPLYLGVMNYFARWASAPLFRMWWPLLKTMYPQPFTRFLENQYGLAGVGSHRDGLHGVCIHLGPHQRGFATDCWLQKVGKKRLDENQHYVSYRLRMHYRSAQPYELQAAQVLVTVVESEEPGVYLALWDAADFFVPPGLWGVGIGEDFLEQLCAGRMPDLPGPGATGQAAIRTAHFLVRFTLPSSTDLVRCRSVANEIQLYRSVEFSDIEMPNGCELRLGGQLYNLGSHLSEPSGSARSYHWMARTVGRDRPRESAQHGGPDAHRGAQPLAASVTARSAT
jgi:hypothetical protein